MHLRRPPLRESPFVLPVPHPRHVIQKRVKPHINRLLVVKRYGDPPRKPLPADRHILQPRVHQAQDLVPPALRLNELRVRLVVRQQPIPKRRQPKEVILLLHHLQRRRRMVRALPPMLGRLLLRLERLATRAIQPLVRLLVNVPRVMHGLDKLLAPRMMPRLARLNKVIKRNPKRPPHLLKLPGHVIHVSLRRNPQLLGPLRHLHRVLVIAHQEEDVEPLHPPKPRLHVRPDLLKRRPDMRPAVRIINRRRDVKPPLLAHGLAQLFLVPRTNAHSPDDQPATASQSPARQAATTSYQFARSAVRTSPSPMCTPAKTPLQARP